MARDDIADVAAVVLTDRAFDGSTLELTGPEAFTMAEAAAELSRATGRDIAYHAETVDEAFASRAHYGASQFEVDGWVTSYAAIAAGEMSTVADTVERVAGHPAVSLTEYLGHR